MIDQSDPLSDGAKAPNVTVVIPVLNAVRTVSQQIVALLASAQDPFEIIAVDNGSSDGTLEVLQALSSIDSRIRLIDGSRAKRGGAGAKNLGVDNSRSDIILFCDADDLVNQAWFSAMAQSVNRTGIATSRREYWKLNPSFVRRAYPEYRDQYRVGDAPGLPGGAFAIKRDLYCSIGGFDEDFHGAVDSEFSLRLFDRFKLEPTHSLEAVVHCRVPETATARFRRERLISRSRHMLDTHESSTGGELRALSHEANKLARVALRAAFNNDPACRYEAAGKAGAALGRASCHWQALSIRGRAT